MDVLVVLVFVLVIVEILLVIVRDHVVLILAVRHLVAFGVLAIHDLNAGRSWWQERGESVVAEECIISF